MRRFLSVMAVLVLLLSLSVSAFAAPPSISQTPPEVSGPAIGANGEEVAVTVSEFKPEAGETVETVAQSALEAAKELPAVSGEDVTVAEVFDIDMTDGTQPDGSVTVTFVRDTSTGEVAAVMYQKDDGTWDSAWFEVGANGALTVTFEHFCTVVIVTKAVEQTPDTPKPTPTPGGTTPGGTTPGGTTGGSGSSSTGGSSSGSPTSPKTGFDASAWIFAMAALTACAAFCFVRAGKKSN